MHNYMRNKKQHGSALVWFVSLTFIFLMVALVVDGSNLYNEKRRLQAAANAVASELAASGQTCFGSELASDATDLSNNAETILARDYSGRDFVVTSAQVVTVDGVDGRYQVSPVVFDARESNGVAVSLSSPVRGLLAIFLEGDLSAHSVARKEVIATISTINQTAVLAQDNTVLGAVLGGVLGIGPIDPTDLTSLAGTTASIGELLQALGVDDVADLVSPVLSAEDLAQALQVVGAVTEPTIDILDAAIQAGGLDGIPLSDVLGIVKGTTVPEDSEFPLYDTVTSLVLKVAELAFSLPPITLDIPGLPGEEVTLELVVNQAPTVLIGAARWDPVEGDWLSKAYGADIELTLTVNLDLGSLLGLSLGSLTVPLAISTGQGEVDLIAAQCASGNSQQVTFTTNASVSGVGLDGEIDASLVGGLIAVNAQVAASLFSSDNGQLHFEVTLLESDEPRTVVHGYNSGQSVTNVGRIRLTLENLEVSIDELELLELLGLNGLVEGLINSVVSPILSSLSVSILTPLLSSLGVQLGTLTVSVDDARQGAMSLIECSQALCASGQ